MNILITPDFLCFLIHNLDHELSLLHQSNVQAGVFMYREAPKQTEIARIWVLLVSLFIPWLLQVVGVL